MFIVDLYTYRKLEKRKIKGKDYRGYKRLMNI